MPNLFDLENVVKECANYVVIPVPWDVTCSYHRGCHRGPQSIIEAADQLDLFKKEQRNAATSLWQDALFCEPIPEKQLEINHALVSALAKTPGDGSVIDQVNQDCSTMLSQLQGKVANYLSDGKQVAVIGGDHSISLAPIRAHASCEAEFGVLQIDAHMDLRIAYEGFTYSHASVMHHVAQLPQVSRLVQLAVRDYCEQEYQLMQDSNGRIQTFFDNDIKSAQYQGETWDNICHRIINALPERVYISLDIDGLDPSLCPNTGTPVPGGLSFSELEYLLHKVREHRTVVGVDLVEVGMARNQWDGNVAARCLAQLLSTINA